jgi:hypothetical protein
MNVLGGGSATVTGVTGVAARGPVRVLVISTAVAEVVRATCFLWKRSRMDFFAIGLVQSVTLDALETAVLLLGVPPGDFR